MLILTEKIDVMCLVVPAEVGVGHILLLLVLLLHLWLLLLVKWRVEMSEGIRKVMAGEAAPVACHCAIWEVLPLGSSCAILMPDYRHAVAGSGGADDLEWRSRERISLVSEKRESWIFSVVGDLRGGRLRRGRCR